MKISRCTTASVGALLTTAFIFSSNLAIAASTLEVSSGAFTNTVIDNGTGDGDPTLGVLLSTGPIGDWNVNVNTGVSKPVLGTTSAPNMDLSSIVVSSTGTANDVMVSFWDFDFSANGSNFFSTAIGGTVQNADISWEACVDDANGVACTSITSGAFTGEGFFGANDVGSAGLSGDYSIGLIATISPDEAGSVSASLDFQITAVPVPAAAWLFGSGLIGLVGFIRRKKS